MNRTPNCCSGTCNQGRTCPARRRQNLDRLAAQLGRLWLFICAVIVAGLVLLATSHPANAATVGLHIATAHFGGHDMQSRTPGVYLVTGEGLTLGAYRNSHGLRSTYAGWTWRTEDDRFALTAGGVTGYPGGTVLPLLVPSVRIPLDNGVSARLSVLPKPARHGGAGGLHLSIERRF